MIDMMKERKNVLNEGNINPQKDEGNEGLEVDQLEEDSNGSNEETMEERAQRAVEAVNKMKYIRLHPKNETHSVSSEESKFTDLNRKRTIENWKKTMIQTKTVQKERAHQQNR